MLPGGLLDGVPIGSGPILPGGLLDCVPVGTGPVPPDLLLDGVTMGNGLVPPGVLPLGFPAELGGLMLPGVLVECPILWLGRLTLPGVLLVGVPTELGGLMLPGVLLERLLLSLGRWMPLGVLLPEILEGIMGVAPGVLLVKIPGGMTMIPPGVLLLWTEVGLLLEIAPLEGYAAELLGELEVTLAGGTEDPVAVVLPVGLLQTLEGEAEAPGELDTLEDKIADDPVTELAETVEDGTELLAALDQADDPASGEVAGVEEPEAELAGGGAAKVPEDGAA
ncbi:unnamed protein product [Alternaria alternata]